MIEIVCLSFLTLFSIISIINNAYYIFLLKNESELDDIDPKTYNYFVNYSFLLAKGERNKILGLSAIEWKAHLYFAGAIAVGFFLNIFVAIIVTLSSFVLLCVKKKVNEISYKNNN